MKQRILVAAASVVLAALILLFAPLSPREPSQPVLPTRPIVPTTTTPTTLPTTPTTVPTTLPADPGVVRIYTCDMEKLAVYTELANEYTRLTGTEILLLTPGDSDCQTTLRNLMESEDPPTVLCLHSQENLHFWQDQLLDLRETVFGQSVCSDDLGFRVNGKLLAVPMGLEGYGLLLNAQLLSVVETRSEITDMAALSTAAKILRDNSLKAFANADLAGMQGLYLLQSGDSDMVRTFLKLYASYKASGDDGLTQFTQGKAVFYLGTTGDYNLLAQQQDRKLELRDLDIISTCTTEGIHYICRMAWAVNGSARQEDIDATLNFLAWLVNIQGDAVPLDRLGILTPFRDAKGYANQLEKKLLNYMRTERATLMWMPDAKAGVTLLEALDAYLKEPNDQTWAAVVRLLPTE